MCKTYKAGIKYTDTKKSGSNILYFDVDVAFYVFIGLRAIKFIITSDIFIFQFTVLKVSMIFKIIIVENVWKKNPQKFLFDFVAFLVSLSISNDRMLATVIVVLDFRKQKKKKKKDKQ